MKRKKRNIGHPTPRLGNENNLRVSQVQVNTIILFRGGGATDHNSKALLPGVILPQRAFTNIRIVFVCLYFSRKPKSTGTVSSKLRMGAAACTVLLFLIEKPLKKTNIVNVSVPSKVFNFTHWLSIYQS